eukprot:TRINITY_DN11411_c1_g1_i1.p1 TRINITY_DN11411_c1_g1~~TRINITY_DN11411_c1_g1_i1.p1  ORF type:complete len:501 (-),score=96.38 TRINITY_DN11411_c1_g1_i1:455-1957(-)
MDFLRKWMRRAERRSQSAAEREVRQTVPSEGAIIDGFTENGEPVILLRACDAAGSSSSPHVPEAAVLHEEETTSSKHLDNDCTSAELAQVTICASPRKEVDKPSGLPVSEESEVERGPPLSESGRTRFEEIEFFDKVKVVSGASSRGKYRDLILCSGQQEFRFTVNSLPPALDSPMDCPFSMDHPMLVMHATHVNELCEIPSHTQARKDGRLLELRFETLSVTEMVDFGFTGSSQQRKHVVLPVAGQRVLNPLRRIVYVAHRWRSRDKVDDADNSKLRLLQRTLLDTDYVWLDAWSVPDLSQLLTRMLSQQLPEALAKEAVRTSGVKAAAIRSMPAYVYWATVLRVISTSELDFDAFLGRTWCQAELLAAMCPVLRERTFSVVGKRRSYSNAVYRHACSVELAVSGRDIEMLRPAHLRKPLDCDVSDPNDLQLLSSVLEKLREVVEAAIPRDERIVVEASFRRPGEEHHEAVSGLEPEAVAALLRATSWDTDSLSTRSLQ